MPRFRRRFSRGAARRARRTTWVGNYISFATIGSLNDVIIFDPRDDSNLAAKDLFRMSDPVLVRLVGSLLLDPDFDPQATGPTQFKYTCGFYVSELAYAAINATTLGNEGWLGTRAMGMSGNHYVTTSTAVGHHTWGHLSDDLQWHFDLKAKRRLGETGKVRLILDQDNSLSQPIDGKYTLLVRGLFME